MTASVVWMVLAGVLFVLEMFTTGILAIWFAIGAAITAIALLICPTLSVAVQVVLFGATSGILFLLTHKTIRKHFEKNASQPVYSIIGKVAVVTKEIDSMKGTGQISVNGDIWSAKTKSESQVIPEQTKVQILEIDGVKAVVQLLPTEEK